ncbi:conserved hypothetical protein-transmembrane region and signal peptide prediction [Magnetococcus marinus MC-1]|uniref:Cytochrome C Planctomycete-type domain-containing protein n=1 Tax=Magnetococcus marinus (strain ATCC BAA-1437 / JCM 17883 / MC-1) TaxID=156889 RepID=A0L4G9_MAGMM|nr:c-type cytochrome domain-containing protein [Magnetococcus marinus]ABK42862.1 conserved hypothetical protein-transmembrane region and signal peptide prediction [Magnetococcus marinus MC-1]
MANKVGMRSLLAGAALALGLMSGSAVASEMQEMTFKEDVYPIITYRCLECHVQGGPGMVYSGLDLQSYEGLMRGTKHGPVVVAGKPMLSNLLVLVSGKAGIRMPHNRRRLTKCEIDIISKWIQQGAKNN